MATETTNYKLTKPAGTDKYDISVFNTNFDKIDAQMKANADKSIDVDAALSDTSTNPVQNNIVKSAIDDVQSTADDAKSIAEAALPLAGGTMTGKLVAQSNTEYTTAQVRNIYLSTEEPSDSVGNNGDIWFIHGGA